MAVMANTGLEHVLWIRGRWANVLCLGAVRTIMALGLFLPQTPGLGGITPPLQAGDSHDSSLASGVPGS